MKPSPSKIANALISPQCWPLLLCNPSVLLLLQEEAVERCAYLLEAGGGFGKLIPWDIYIVNVVEILHYLKCHFSLSMLWLTVTFLALLGMEFCGTFPFLLATWAFVPFSFTSGEPSSL